MAAGKILFFVFAIIFGMAWSEDKPLPTEKDYEEIISGCHKIYPIEPSEIQDLINSVHKEDADRLQKCFLKCFLVKTDTMDEEGNFNVQRIYDIAYARHKHEMNTDPMKGIKECVEKHSAETNPCLKAFTATRCVADKKLWGGKNEL